MNKPPDQLPNLSSLSHEQKDELIRMLFPLIAEVQAELRYLQAFLQQADRDTAGSLTVFRRYPNRE